MKFDPHNIDFQHIKITPYQITSTRSPIRLATQGGSNLRVCDGILGVLPLKLKLLTNTFLCIVGYAVHTLVPRFFSQAGHVISKTIVNTYKWRAFRHVELIKFSNIFGDTSPAVCQGLLSPPFSIESRPWRRGCAV